MSKKKVLLRGVFINRDTNGEGVLKVGTTLIRVSTVMGILYMDNLRCGKPEVESGDEKMRMLIWSEEVQRLMRDITLKE